MLTVYTIATIVLNIIGIGFALVFLWLNIFVRYSDLRERNTGLLKQVKLVQILSMVFALLTCLFSDVNYMGFSVGRSTLLFSIIGISWLAIIMLTFVGMIYLFGHKKSYTSEAIKDITKILKMSLVTAIISLLLSWLFS